MRLWQTLASSVAAAALLASARPAHADNACPPAGPSRGYRPVMQGDVGCAIRLGKPIFVAVGCSMRVEGEALPRYDVLPGAKVAVLADSDGGAHIKLPSGEEGDISSICLSWSDTGVSLLPNRSGKNDVSTAKALLKSLYQARKGIEQDLYTFMKKRDFLRTPAPDFEQPHSSIDPAAAYTGALYFAGESYGALMRSLIYGINATGVSSSTLLELDASKWMADWPAVIVESYAHGLTGHDRTGAEAADKELALRADALSRAIELTDLTRREKFAEIEIQRVPEDRRASERKLRFDEFAAKRKDLTSKLQRSQKDANEAQLRARF